MEAIHKAVLTTEIIENLNIKASGKYIDCTLGGGEHSLNIANKLTSGMLISLDIDNTAIKRYIKKAEQIGFNVNTDSEIKNYYKNNFKGFVFNENFANLDLVLNSLKIQNADGIIADLGWSSDQLEDVEGLSFEKLDSELDMRFDKSLNVKAKDLLNILNKKNLIEIFKNNADLNYKESNLLAEIIIKNRNNKAFERVKDLTELIEINLKKLYTKKDLARIFQALRITVNTEYSNLITLINKGVKILNQNGRFAIITFHSGEFNIVKDCFTELVQSKKANWIKSKEGKKFIQPSLDELKINPRSRSAKLLIIEKI